MSIPKIDPVWNLDNVLAQFADRFGGKPDVVVSAPGRLNLLGEHVDYNDGIVLPMAINRRVWVAARAVHGPTQVVSREAGESESFDANSVMPAMLEGWASYPAGAAWALREIGAEDLPNLEAYVASDVPVGAGASSSAALDVAFLKSWDHFLGLEMSGLDIARSAQTVENRFVGVGCGLMDPVASAMGRADHALRFDCRTEMIRYVPIPADWQVVIADTGARRALKDAEFNARRMECEAVARALEIQSLRDATLESIANVQGVSEVSKRRASYVVREIARVEAMVEALELADAAQVSLLMRAGQAGLRDDFEVSGSELDAMVAACEATDGTIGVRLSGAGFAGVCVVIVHNDAWRSGWQEGAASQYQANSGRLGAFWPVSADDGVRVQWTLG